MTRLEALVGLNMVSGIGSTRLNQLLKFFEKPENILRAPAEKLAQVFGIGHKISGEISSLKEQGIKKELDLAGKYNLNIITIDDGDYPVNLKQIFDPPIVLYVKGRLKSDDKFSIGIVGSRRASFYGLSCAEIFSGDLADCGMTVVSGLARGIDTYAHKGALKRGKRTIAVIGSGFKHLYPAENKELAEEISQSGAVISEFPINARPLPQNFPRRNRVISGLSLGVLVVEAARNSGALITADYALEQGREVFALPGKIDSENSFGTNELIKQGAKLVSCADDIMEEFNVPGITNINIEKMEPTRANPSTSLAMVRGNGERPSATLKDALSERSESNGRSRTKARGSQGRLPAGQAGNTKAAFIPALKDGVFERRSIKETNFTCEPPLAGNESFLYNLISDKPLLLDEIVQKTGFGIPELSAMLLKLQVRRLIRQVPGKQFVRTNA